MVAQGTMLQVGLAKLVLAAAFGCLTYTAVAARAASADDHWAFQRIAAPPPPATDDASRRRTAVDPFIGEKLATAGLRWAEPAGREVLLRRLTLDLIGLPPTIGERTDFLADSSPDAVSRLTDRLLASPQYGPRWGRYWLDAAGYADSNGYFSADSDRPLAWQYRDYVIAAHNADMPFDQFVREQLAGDELSGFDPAKPVQPEWADALIATHYLRNAPDGTGESDGNPDEVRVDRYTVLEGTLQILGSSLLGLTLQCARCHDHKFEPLPQREYYQLQAFLYPAYDVEQWVKPNERVVQLGERKIAWLSDLAPTPPEVALLVRGDPKQRGDRVLAEVPAVLRDPLAPLRFEPPPARRTTGRRLALARWITHPNSRAAALLARVTANRVWQYHFTTGIVATPENLGVTGAAPSHAALLECLAGQLAANEWSLKRLHREIVLSATYAQASAVSADARRLDPDNRLLSRYPLHRLEADALRDALFATSDELDRALNGPFVPTKRNGNGEVIVEPQQAGLRRRSVYLQQRRTQIESFLASFDTPSIVASCSRRPVTTTPLQSLAQLNSPLVRQRAERLADRLLAGHASNDDWPAATRTETAGDRTTAVTRLALLLILGRTPLPEERAAAAEFLAAQLVEYGSAEDALQRATTDLCQMLLASNAFLYVE